MKKIQTIERNAFKDIPDKNESLKQELKTIQRKYQQLEEKNKAMKLLELDLRYKLYQVTTRLNKEIQDKFTANDVFVKQVTTASYNIFMSSEVYNVLLSSFKKEDLDVVNWKALDNELKRCVITIHRPYQQVVYPHGLGEEMVLSMDKETNQTENQPKDSISHPREIETVIDESLVVKNNEDIGRSKTRQFKDIQGKKTNEIDRLRQQVTELQGKLARNNNKPQTKTTAAQPKANFFNRKENTPIKTPEIKNPTFRELQQAEHIYSKPSFGDKTKTITSINRDINPELQLSYTQKQIEDPTIKQLKVAEDGQRDRENIEKQEAKKEKLKYVKSNSELPTEKTLAPSNKIEPNQLSTHTRTKEITPQSEDDIKNATHTIEKSVHSDYKQNKVRPHVQQTNDDQVNKHSESVDEQKPTRTQTKHKKESFFKSLWKRIK